MLIASFLEVNECLLHSFLRVKMFVASFLEGSECLLHTFWGS